MKKFDKKDTRIINIPRGAIQVENNITLLQKKLWYELVYNAFPNMKEQRIFTIKLQDLMKRIGWKDSENYTLLKASLRGLVEKSVEWNIFNKDKDQIWETFSMLAGCRIAKKSGICSYDFSSFLQDKFLEMGKVFYTKIDLMISHNFSSKYSLAIYSLALDYLILDKNYGEKIVEISDLRKFLGIKKDEYKLFADFKKRILIPAEKEINEISDIDIDILPEKEKGSKKISKIRIVMRLNSEKAEYYKSLKIEKLKEVDIKEESKNKVNVLPEQIIKKDIKPKRALILIQNPKLKEFFLEYKISITTNTIQDKFSELKEMLEHRFEGYVTYLMEYTKNQIKVSNITNVSGFFVGLLRTGSQFENYITEEQRKDNIRLSKEGRVKTLIESKIKENYNKYVKNDFSYYLESNIDELEEEIIKIVELTYKKDTLFYDFAIKSKNNGLIDINLVRTNDRGVKTLLFNHLEEHKDKFDYEPLTFEEWKNQEITDEYLKELETELLKTL